MSRNSAGTYSLPVTGNPVITGTTVSSTVENAFRADVASELSNSLDRQGRGAMLAPLQSVDGSSSAPGVTFGSESTSGLYRAGAGDLRLMVLGTEVLKLLSSAVTSAIAWTVGALTVSGNVTMSGSNPASTTGFSNVLTKMNTPKAWGHISIAGGVLTVDEGFNVASVAFSGTAIVVTFATALANASHSCTPHTLASQTTRVLSKTASSVTLRLSDYTTGNDIDPRSGSYSVWFTVFGKQ